LNNSNSSIQGDTTYQVAGNVLNDIEERLFGVRAEFGDAESIVGLATGGSGVDPFQAVLVEECSAMRAVIRTVLESLAELSKALEGVHHMNADLESLATSLFANELPQAWSAVSWRCECGLSDWLADLLKRTDQLRLWLSAPESPPTVIWIGGLFSPRRFLAAVLQKSAQLQQVELSSLMLMTEVTRHSDEDHEGLDPPSRDSVLMKGLTLSGARFDASSGMLADTKRGSSAASSALPVIAVRAVPKVDFSSAGVYMCPVYEVKTRGDTWVFDVALKTKSPKQKWIIAGVALILDSKK
jgi:dynein heavy chain